jgi:acyl-CoA thioester hydrolase
MTKTLESDVLIRFPDCDPFNHLNNARYIDYFINAREDHLMRLGFNIYDVARDPGLSWVVGSHRIAYLRPALLMEKVIIDSTLIAWRERDLVVEMRMWNQDKSELKSLLWTTFVHVNLRTGKSIPHSEEFTRLFADYVAPLPDPGQSFEARLVALQLSRDRET